MHRNKILLFDEISILCSTRMHWTAGNQETCIHLIFGAMLEVVQPDVLLVKDVAALTFNMALALIFFPWVVGNIII